MRGGTAHAQWGWRLGARRSGSGGSAGGRVASAELRARSGTLGRRQVTADSAGAARPLLAPYDRTAPAREWCGVAEAGPCHLGADGARGTGGAPRGPAWWLWAPQASPVAALLDVTPSASPRLSPAAASATLRPREEAG